MPVSFFPSSEGGGGDKQNTTARKRRRKQNVEIDELGDLLPFQPVTGKSLDKLSILRLTTSYMRFQTFMTAAYGDNGAEKDGILTNLIEMAMDGFLLVIDSDATILYASTNMESFVGLNPRDVIGHSLDDLVESESDSQTIRENLEAKGTQLNQQRLFYIRLRNAVIPGRVRLSRYTTNMMLQVSGHLKVVLDHSLNITFSKLSPELTKIDPDMADSAVPQKPHVLGLIVVCRPIESCPSVLELTSSPQTSFSSTVSMADMKIQAVDTKVKEILGFDPKDFVGSSIKDYFHPMDNAKMMPCKDLLLRTGYACSPVFRIMTASGEWSWVQMEGTLRFDKETREPLHLDTVIKIVSQSEGTMKYIEQQEFYSHGKYTSNRALHHQDPYDFLVPDEPPPQTHQTLVDGLQKAEMSDSSIGAFLHSRQLALSQQPGSFKDIVSSEEEADKLQARNLVLIQNNFDVERLMKEGMTDPRDFVRMMKELQEKGAAEGAGSGPPTQAEISPPNSVLSAPSPASSVSQPGSIPPGSQPGSIPSTSSVTSFDSLSPGSVPATLSSSPQSVLSVNSSCPNSAPPSVFYSGPPDSTSPDSGIDSPLSTGSDSIPSAIKTESTGNAPVPVPYTLDQFPFQNSQIQQNGHASMPPFSQTDSTGYSFQPQATAIPPSFNFAPSVFTQQVNSSVPPSLSNDALDMLLTDLSGPYPPQQQEQQLLGQQPPQQGEAMQTPQQGEAMQTPQQMQNGAPVAPQDWAMKQQALQDQILQQQKLIQELLAQQKMQLPQQQQQQYPTTTTTTTAYEPRSVHDGSVSSLTPSPSPSSSGFATYQPTTVNNPAPQSFGLASPLPPHPTKDNQNRINHGTIGATNVSVVGSVDFLASSGDNMSPSAALELQDLWQQLHQ